MITIGKKNIKDKNVSVHVPDISIRFSTACTTGQWVAETGSGWSDIIAMETTLIRLLEILWAKGLITESTKSNILKEIL